ncbi:Na(+)/H(+) antiporter subunit B [Aureimonas fodinaquatilis]|uniref:Na(+)/H(+) antiporter subunit B n=1 Tax=Aureimonas fodinaquatilis TaxID=2565783 RepID=A0A5B0DZT4_9HYPH|nr:Na(+)/H(+) antiporter subunit B [Aureimonas fodinaquatilis]KAA0972304.1 Na(+)/H(+) antiporter subunit B [Aureimonas fodinaquatilis]
MRTVIFRVMAPYLTSLMFLFSLFVLLRGHNEPGGGFAGGLIAASAIAVYGMAVGVDTVRRALHFHPIGYAGFGLIIAVLAGCASIFAGFPFMTGLWWFPNALGGAPISTALFFDVGVYLVVVGSISSIALSLEERYVD